MKKLTVLLSISLACGAQEINEEMLELLPTPTFEEEIAAFELDSLTTDPFATEEFNLPAPPVELPRKTTFVAVGLSYIFPGLGNAYLGDMKTASGLMGAAGTSIGLLPVTAKHTNSLLQNMVAIQTTWQYGAFAAYRDVRAYNQQTGYAYQMPRDSFTDLLSAPFSFRVLKKPEVWGGFLGAMALATATSYFFMPEEAHAHFSCALELNLPPYVAFPIGIGEEALFRGFFQSELSEGLTPWGGLAASSILFGAAHIPNALLLEPEDRWRYYAFSLPLITALGAYFGWMTQKNHSLRESVALHSWYDFTLFAGAALANQAATTRRGPFVLSIPISF
jgi:membrane protease YdiL (CAAX protease family)